MNGAVWQGLAAAGAAAGAGAAAAAGDRIAARVAADFPGVAVTVEPGAVRLQARGLVARAFGSRRRAADPRLAGLVDDVGRGGT